MKERLWIVSRLLWGLPQLREDLVAIKGKPKPGQVRRQRHSSQQGFSCPADSPGGGTAPSGLRVPRAPLDESLA